MPTILRAVSSNDFSGSRHHGGGVMSRGGWDVADEEVSVAEYARQLVLTASMDVAYRKWENQECVTLDNRFYLFHDGNKNIELVRVGKKQAFQITGNENWRVDARKWIEENYEDDPISDVILAKTCAKFGESL